MKKIEKNLYKLFDFQKYENNKDLEEIIRRVLEKYETKEKRD